MEKFYLRRQHTHSDLRAANIFISENGEIKFPDSMLVDVDGGAYYKTITKLAKCPLPPELLVYLRANDPYPVYDRQAAEIWFIGIILLSAATSIPDYYFYDWSISDVNGKLILHWLDQLQFIYSDLFIDLLRDCLNFIPKSRATFLQIEEYIHRRKLASKNIFKRG